jgi:hypothetical protein
MERKILQNEFGFINYSYIEPNVKHSTGLLLFMGSYINKKFRGQGKFKELVKNLFNKFSDNTKVQVPLSNKSLVPFFKRLEFYNVESIEYWNNPSNAVILEGKINKKLLENN